MLHTDIIEDDQPAEALRPGWDALAVAAGLPYASPGWQLGWWRAARQPRARLLVLAVRDGDELVGLLGLWRRRDRRGVERLRLLGSAYAQGTAPLAAPGREAEVASALAHALAGLRPRAAVLELEGVPGGSRWAELLCAAWPGRGPTVLRRPPVPGPFFSLEGGVDAWLARRSSGFRQQLRRSRRGLEREGVTLRRACDPTDIAALVPERLRLHEARWADRGGSDAVDERTGAVLIEAARALAPEGRLHVEVAERGGAVLAAHLFLCAGAEVTYWLGGFDDAVARERPGLVALLTAAEHAAAGGITRFDLGPGTESYKQRFADDQRELDWIQLVLPGAGRPLALAWLVPRRLAAKARARVRG